jgi:hypothetical protein
MRLRSFLFLAGLLYAGAAHADCSTLGWKTVKPSVNSNQLFSLTAPVDKTVYDFQNTRIFAKASNFMISVKNAKNICITHAFVESSTSRDILYWDLKKDFDWGGIAFQNVDVGEHIIEYSIVKNNEDAWYFPRDPVATPDGAHMTVRHSYLAYGRDDTLEADGCPTQINLDNVLVDNGHQGFSDRPGAGYKHSQDKKVVDWNITDSAFYLGCKPDDRDINKSTCPPKNGVKTGQGAYFKAGCQMHIHAKNVIFRLDYIAERGATSGTMDFPVAGSTYDNVTMIWRGPGNYPGTLPKSGVTVTNSLTPWTNFRNKWKQDHGCTDNAAGDEFTGCTWNAVNDPLPPDVSTIALASDRINITETRPADFQGNEFRGATNPNATWDTATIIGSSTTNNFLLLSAIPVDDLIIFAKEKDTAGQYSANPVSVAVNLAPPPDLTSIVQQTSAIACTGTKPPDFSGFQFRTGLVADAAWTALTDFGTPQAACSVTTASLPTGTQRVCAKEKDTGGLFSVNAVCLNVQTVVVIPPTLGLTTTFANITPNPSGGSPVTGQITLTRTGDTTADATANIKMTGRTSNPVVVGDLAGNPATLPDSPLTVPAGRLTVNRNYLFAAQDLTVDHGGTITAYNPSGATLAGTTTFDFTLVHNNVVVAPTVGFTTTFSSVTPNNAGGAPVVVPYVVTRSGDKTASASVFVQMTGRTANPIVVGDLTGPPATLPDVQVTVPAGQSTIGGSFSFAPQDLTVAHGGTVTLHSPSGATIAGTSTFNFNLLSNKGPPDDPPPDIPSIAVDTAGQQFTWVAPVQPPDFFGYEPRVGTSLSSVWATMADVGSPLTVPYLATSFPFSSLPAGSQQFCVKELDNAKQESKNAVCADVPIDGLPPDITSMTDVGDRIIWAGPIPSDFKGFEIGYAADAPTAPAWSALTLFPWLA